MKTLMKEDLKLNLVKEYQDMLLFIPEATVEDIFGRFGMMDKAELETGVKIAEIEDECQIICPICLTEVFFIDDSMLSPCGVDIHRLHWNCALSYDVGGGMEQYACVWRCAWTF